MLTPADDTIVAIASAPGGALRGVVRVSGPAAVDCVARCFSGHDGAPLPQSGPPRAIPGSLRVSGVASPLPCDAYLWPTRQSYTRQPVAELHTIGSPPLLDAVLEHLCRSGARLAEPGEFTLRAFLAGRIDLLQAEAVLAVIDAHSPRALDRALDQLAGGVTLPLQSLREELLELLADVEAGLDFAEEEIAQIPPEQLAETLRRARVKAAELIRRMAARTQSDQPLQAALIGRTNAGKSSLFNALTGRPAALTSRRPGTTRDYLTARLELGGIACCLIDTAGVAESTAERSVSAAAQQMAREAVDSATLRLLCIDHSQPLTPWDQDQLDRMASDPQRGLVVLTKSDLPPAARLPFAAINTSSRTRQGLEELRRQLRRAAFDLRDRDEACGAGVVSATASRCRESMRSARQSLREAFRLARSGQAEELVAVEIRSALQQIGRVAGSVHTEDILDRVFSRFCIGK